MTPPASLLRFASIALLACATAAPAIAHDGLHEHIEALAPAIANAPGDAALLLKRGDLRRQHREWDAATADLTSAAKLNPALPGLDLALARLAIDRGDDATARPWLDRHLASRPDSALGYTLRAELLEREGRPAAAARD